MKKLVAKIDWCGENYSALIAVDGVIVVTANTLDELLSAIGESIELHIPNEEYELAYQYRPRAKRHILIEKGVSYHIIHSLASRQNS